jgi:hypothetical protein
MRSQNFPFLPILITPTGKLYNTRLSLLQLPRVLPEQNYTLLFGWLTREAPCQQKVQIGDLALILARRWRIHSLEPYLCGSSRIGSAQWRGPGTQYRGEDGPTAADRCRCPLARRPPPPGLSLVANQSQLRAGTPGGTVSQARETGRSSWGCGRSAPPL